MIEVKLQTRVIYDIKSGPEEDTFECKDLNELTNQILKPANLTMGIGRHSHLIFKGNLPVGQIKELSMDQ